MKKQPKNKNNLAILITVIVLVVAFVTVNKQNQSSTPPQTQVETNQIKTVYSKSLKFSIDVLSSSSITDAQTYLNITTNGKTIDIVRNGTNFSSLQTYLEDFDKKKIIIITNNESSIINNYQTVSRIETNPNNELVQKVYYIYVDNWVYSLSTSSEVLFGDLDQIAQSFRYTP